MATYVPDTSDQSFLETRLMTKQNKHKSIAGRASKKLDTFETNNVRAEADAQYASGWLPILLLAIPFIAILIYGYFS